MENILNITYYEISLIKNRNHFCYTGLSDAFDFIGIIYIYMKPISIKVENK